VLTGLPLGHIRDKMTLAIGGEANLVSRADGFELTMHRHATL
jgi:muramoyltetrapeptide carboxypeptidase